MTTTPGARRQQIVPASYWLAIPSVLAFVLIAITSSETLPITAPLALVLLACGLMVFVLWRRQRGLVPWFEIGVVYCGIVTLYTVYPLVRFLVAREELTTQNDWRWAALNLTTADVGQAAWLYVVHLSSFVLVYLVVRGRLPLTHEPMKVPPGKAVLIAALAGYALIEGFWLFLGLFYDTRAGSYIESYLVSGRLPLILAQLLNHLNGIKYPLSLLVLATLFTRYPSSRPIIVGWLLVLGALTFTRLGSRTELALFVMSAGMMYHTLIRPIAPRVVVGACLSGLVLFMLLGMLRSGRVLAADVGTFNPFVAPSEFDVLYATVLELRSMSSNGTLGSIPSALYMADIAALVPQQIAPFEKVEPAAWYVWTFYPEYAAAGGGLAFGTMAEAALTGGLVSALLRGAALGFCFAKIHRFYVHHAERYWVFVFYVWATTLCYQSFRATTFFLLVLFTYRFLPAMIGVKVLATILSRAAREARSLRSLITAPASR